ncbi:MAG: GntR family transcriptional regulator [Pararhizobium sp.]
MKTLTILEAIDWTSAIDPKLPIATQAHAWIKRAILTLELKPNEALSEKELALKFGISRTPVREALIKLADEGLVDIFPQRGTYVSPIRVPEVIEAQFIREALETAVVRKAAETADERLKARLRANLAEQHAAMEAGRHQDFMQLDEAFHHAFSDFCNAPRAWRVIQNVKGQLDRVRYLSLPHPGHVAQLYQQHKAVADAVEAGAVDVAVGHMSHHLREVFKSIDELMREQPGLFA